MLLPEYRDRGAGCCHGENVAPVSGHTWLTDTAQETNGLPTAAREPKPGIPAVRAITPRPAGSVPSEILDALFRHEVEARRGSRREG